MSRLITETAALTGLNESVVRAVIDAAGDVIVRNAEAGEPTRLPIGTFVIRHRKARVMTNPHTGEPVNVAAKTVLAFKPGKRAHLND